MYYPRDRRKAHTHDGTRTQLSTNLILNLTLHVLCWYVCVPLSSRQAARSHAHTADGTLPHDTKITFISKRPHTKVGMELRQW